MKKAVSLVLTLMLLMTAAVCFAEGEILLGQVQYAAHGTGCFAVITVALQDDVIVAAKIDEYQFIGSRDDLFNPIVLAPHLEINGAVVDAVSIAREIDGMLVVIRENTCPRSLLDECMRQLEYADVRILGFVVNGAMEGSGKKYQYGKYGKYGYSSYGYY